MKVLESEIQKGNKKLALFYGSAHMPDFEKRLVRDLGMRKTKQFWGDAWDLQSAPDKASPVVTGIADMLVQLMDST